MGIPYRYAMSLTSQFFFCGVPFRLDSTPKCSVNCSYCFAMANKGGRKSSTRLIADPNRIARKLAAIHSNGKSVSDVQSQMLNKRVPLHFGGMSDPFSNTASSKVSRELLRILDEFDYPVLLSTKNTDALIEPETLTILENMKHLAIQVSFSTTDARIAAMIEPFASTPEARFASMKLLSNLQIPIMVRLQPLMPSLISEYIQSLIPWAADAGTKHVIVEFLKLPVDRARSTIQEVFTALDWDGYAHYKKHNARLVGIDWLLPNSYKWEVLQPIIETIRAYNMTYGAADYGLHHLGDSACCCGTDNLEGFDNWHRGSFANVVRESRVGLLDASLLDKYWYPGGSIRTVLNSDARQDNLTDMIEYLRLKWNQPGTANAPDSYLGVHYAGELDKHGNCIYEKNIAQLF
jgi:DNA repair photolyase